MARYMIEGFADGQWDEANVISSGDSEEVNRYGSEEEAKAVLEELVSAFRGEYSTEKECRESLRVVECDPAYRVFDSGASDGGLTFSEAVARIGEWYEDVDEWSTGEGDDAAHEAVAEAIESIEPPESGGLAELKDYANSIREAVAIALGSQPFAGHGSYYVSAADRDGLTLDVKEEGDEE